MADSDSPDDVEMEEEFLPITEIEINNDGRDSPDDGDSSEDERMRQLARPIISRRAKRRSILYGTPLPNFNSNANTEDNNLNTKPPKMPERPKPSVSIQIGGFHNHHKGPLSPTDDMSLSMSPKVKVNWMKALRKVKSIEDPWECFHIDVLPTERVKRHRYNALKKRWVEDEVEVKMETEPFNHGAMRSCYRLKKVSSFSRSKEWNHASNYVAKLYMENVERDVYFEDVKLQMDAKLWGEEYNRHNPPKKVDIFQMSVIEFINRPNQPLYHLEHFIEGNYIKYNSNSGFVDDSHRFTPQAFSHFTFERSGHKLIVVDVQGVGDLWTDPQIHTCDGKGYGDGNLGTRGMALFFHSHICNSICDSLSLSKFDLATSEIAGQEEAIKADTNPVTRVRGEEYHCFSPSPRDRNDLTGFLLRSRSRTTSMASQSSDDLTSPRSPDVDELEFMEEEPMSPGSPLPVFRTRLYSESSDSSSATLNESDSAAKRKRQRSLTMEEERIRFQQALNRAHRPSCINAEINMLNLSNKLEQRDSTLGQIHHEMAKYHELGRFCFGDNKKIDYNTALYHEEHAAELGILEARITLARLYLGMQREILVDYSVPTSDENTNKGVMYMEMAANAGDVTSIIYLARAYETGFGLGTEKSQSHVEAVKWYEKAISTSNGDDSSTFDATMDSPTYQLQAKVAELYLTGDHGLDKDPNYSGEMYTAAAEGAMEQMKGRLANKYYMLAEEAWSQVEED